MTTLPLEVTYDAGAPSITGPGVFEANILVENDTPYGTLDIPVTMTVEPGDAFGGISGTVQSAGYCGNDPFDAAGALIEVAGDSGEVFTTTADESGFYELFIPIDESPVDVTASAPNHFDGTERGVALVAGSTLTVDFTLDLDEPCIDVDPTEFSSSLLPGETDVQTLNLGNALGAGDLEWNLETATPEAAGSNSAIASATAGGLPTNAAMDLRSVTGGDIPRVSAMPAGAFDCDGAPGLVIHDDGSIENGYSGNPAAGTDVSVVEGFAVDSPANLGTVCVALLTLGPDTRDFELVVYDDDGAGGTPGTEIAAVASTASGIPNGIPDPIVWFTVDLGPAAVSVDAGTVFIGARWNVSDPNVFLASDETGPGGLGLGYFTVDSGEWDQLGVDAFTDYSALFVRPQIADPFGCTSPSDVPWLSFSEDSGTVVGGGSGEVDVTIDSAGLIPGDYEATICVTSNDPVNPLVAVPVALEVGAAAGTGILQGTMESLGYCSENPAPAAGAAIEIVGQVDTYDLVADANGQYTIVLDMAESPVTVNASAPDHLPQSLVDIDLVKQDVVEASMGLVLEASCATAAQDALGMLIATEAVDSDLLTLVNEGAAPYTWDIAFDEAAAENGVFGTVDVVEDGGFELGTPNSAWDEASAAFGTVICNEDGCGLGGGTGPNSGLWWTWFGGIPGGDVGSVSQDVTVPTGSSAELRFFLEIPADGQTGSMDVSLGGDVLFSVTEADAGTYPTYQEVILDVSAYADGGTYELLFASETQSGAASTNFFVDDVALLVQPGPLVCADPQGVSWVSVDQASGTVEADSSVDVGVTYDSTGLAPGEYQASLCLETSDEGNAQIIIPISLEVAVDPLFGDRFEQLDAGTGDLDVDFSRKRPE